jgi:hypothetical protein
LGAGILSSAKTTVCLHLRKQTGTSDSNLSTCRTDAFRSQLEIVIFLQRSAYELLQLGVLEDLPSREVGKGSRVSLALRGLAQNRGMRAELDYGPVVVRKNSARQNESTGLYT